jgi:hypothetical protein
MKPVREAIQKILVKGATTKDNSSKSHLPLNKIPYSQQEREMTLGNRREKADIRHSKGYMGTVNCYSGWNFYYRQDTTILTTVRC